MASNRAAELNGGDDEEAALRHAIAMSLGEMLPNEESAGPSRTSGVGNTQAGVASVRADNATSSRPAAHYLAALGLDRKKMEEERLARLRKRKAEISSDISSIPGSNTHGPPAQRPRLMDEQPSRVSQAPLRRSAASPNSNSHSHQKASASAGLSYYPTGVVLRTWALGTPRDGGDIKIEEVFQKQELELAVLSSYQWDEEWLMNKLDMRQTKVLLVAYAPDEKTKAEMRNNVPQDVIRFVFPPMESVGSYGCMHSKLQLLKYPRQLRIVVPTANLVPYDWGETGTMENMVFLIDVPRIEDPAKRAINALTPFGEELSYFLEAQGVDEKLIHSLRNYDFSETSRYSFIHTIPGSHSEPNAWQRTGYCGLGRAVKARGLDSTGDVDLDYVCPTIGAVKRELLEALYNACKGDSGMKEYEARTGKPRKTKDAASSVADRPDLSKIRVYYPSRDTVIRSRGGTNSAGTIRFQSKHWNSSSFPHEVLRDCKNVRSGLLMHSKVMFVQRSAASSDGSAAGWAYVGSHNLSESAWGRLVKDRNTGEPKLNARNYECGVLIPISPSRSSGASSRGTDGGAETLEAFRSSGLPIPVELPGLPYRDGERRPWFTDES